jgi:hypothetical protein
MRKLLLLFLVISHTFCYGQYQLAPPLGTPLNRSHPLAQGLVGSWLMNEGGGQISFNSVGTGQLNGSLNSGAFYKVAQRGQCISFDGTNDYISVTNPGLLNFVGQTNAFTITAWVQTSNAGATAQAVIGKASVSGAQYQLFSANGILGCIVGDQRSDGTTNIATGKWVFVAVTVPAASSGLKMYLNGTQEALTSGTGAIGTTTQSNDAIIAARHDINNTDYARWWNGNMQNLNIWNRVLSPTEVRQLYVDPYCMYRRNK